MAAEATRVYLEIGTKKVFASAADWPGWCRSGKGDEGALEALASYLPRYAEVATEAGLTLPAGSGGTFEVVERLPGDMTTDFGAPGAVADAERGPLSAADADRLATLVAAAWAVLDRVVRQLGVGEVELAVAPSLTRVRVLAQDVPWVVVPPALLLWRSFADNSIGLTLITPVVVMAAGQLAGGLAWLTISGEDAADLVATAPLPASRVVRAKIEVVLIVIAALFTPLVLALALASPPQAVVTAVTVIIAAGSATAIQLWFRVQARRSQFRRRQTSSRLATFAEAFSSIGWAGTAALALAIPIAAVISGLLTAGILAATWKISPRRE